MGKSKKQASKTRSTENPYPSTNVNNVVRMQTQTNRLTDPMSRENLRKCIEIIKTLKRHSHTAPFLEPVDPVKYGIPDYFDIIKKPMDLGTVHAKLNKIEYSFVNEFINDVKLTFSNCTLYNGVAHQYSIYAKQLNDEFDAFISKFFETKNENLKAPAEPSTKVSNPVVIASPSSRPKNGRKKNNELNFCRKVLQELRKRTHWHYAYPFYEPVDAEALRVPDYYKIITNPMDLSTIGSKLDADQYKNSEGFESDVRQIFKNCYAYNDQKSDVYKMGKMLESVFEKKWSERPSPNMEDTIESGSESETGERDHLRALQRHLSDLSSQISQTKKLTSAKRKSIAGPSVVRSGQVQPSQPSDKSSRSSINSEMLSDVDEDEPLTEEQVAEIEQKIELLSDEKMSELNGSEGYELEIDALDVKTARIMYEFVVNCTNKGKGKEKVSTLKRSRSDDESPKPQPEEAYDPQSSNSSETDSEETGSETV
ncbi:7790_t:CDS:2 [Diversispora eburnea]|uniref:7790_t:CDS:1 n=2 Tax=Diversisporales TaxID=214509 RepID=A0A9N8UWX9_9GLOM|nr:7790_t:CDS:2 [Diversispora eburnea]